GQEGGVDPLLVLARHDSGDGGDGDEGACGVEGFVQVHLEGNGSAGDQGEVDVGPVLVGGVFDDGPAVEGCRRSLPRFVGQDEAIGGLPDGHLVDVGDDDAAGALAGEGEIDGLGGFGAVLGEGGEGLVEFVGEFTVLQLERGDRGEGDRADAGGGDE